ncbi:MAG TPA: YafY family protein [Gammaproteobacteria bacterium]
MRRADRLFQIVLQLGRAKRTKARTLAERLEVSERTIYRDVRDLMGAGVPIEGEAGKGYRLRVDYQVPPMMFDDDELQALAFGAEVAKTWGDRALSDAAERVLSKVHAALPPRLRPKLALSRMHVPDFHVPDAVTELLGVARTAINEKRRLVLHYRDANGGLTERTVWPLGLVYWGGAWTLGAWCEFREDFRTFRVDRIQSARMLSSRIPETPGRSLEDYFAVVSEQFAE